MKISVARIVAAVALILGLCAAWEIWHQEAVASTWDAGVEAVLHTSRTWQSRATAESTSAVRSGHRADSVSAQLDTLYAMLGALHRRFLNNPQADSVVSVCSQIVSRCQEQASLWHAADDSDRARADSAGRWLAVDDSLLRVGVKATTCHVAGLLPCPSRGVLAVLGVVGGVWLGRH